MKKLYIDIDGVLLTAKHTRPAENVIEFIDFITASFDCYWLTTHCKGNTSQTINYLSMYFTNDTLNKLQLVKPTNWQALKTEGIDWDADFYWLDDCPFNAEIEKLKQYNKLHSLIRVNLENSNELINIENTLKQFLSGF